MHERDPRDRAQERVGRRLHRAHDGAQAANSGNCRFGQRTPPVRDLAKRLFAIRRNGRLELPKCAAKAYLLKGEGIALKHKKLRIFTDRKDSQCANVAVKNGFWARADR